jgi:hypothetical protein
MLQVVATTCTRDVKALLLGTTAEGNALQWAKHWRV